MRTKLVLQFYADLENVYNNKLFSFAVKDEFAANNLLVRFADNSNFIRAAFINEFRFIELSQTWVKHESFKLDKERIDILNKVF